MAAMKRRLAIALGLLALVASPWILHTQSSAQSTSDLECHALIIEAVPQIGRLFVPLTTNYFYTRPGAVWFYRVRIEKVP